MRWLDAPQPGLSLQILMLSKIREVNFNSGALPLRAYICSRDVISVRRKQYTFAILVFCPNHNYPSNHSLCRFPRKGGRRSLQWGAEVVLGVRHSGNQYQVSIINSVLKWQREQECDAFTLLQTRALHSSLLITRACLGPNAAAPSHAHSLLTLSLRIRVRVNCCFARSRLWPGGFRRLEQTAAVTMINHLALSFTCRWTPHLGPLKAQNQIFMLFIGTARIHRSSAMGSSEGPWCWRFAWIRKKKKKSTLFFLPPSPSCVRALSWSLHFHDNCFGCVFFFLVCLFSAGA